jgi:hypothetical protein
MRWLRFITGILLIVFLLFLAAFNVRLYSAVPPTGTLSPDVIPHLRFLRQALDEGVGEEMQQFFPEGYFFSYLLYGLTWVDTGLQLPDSSQERQEALSEARWALAQLDSLAGRSAFPESLDPPYGMFYNAWRSYLLAGILLLQPAGEQNPAELAGFQNQTAALAAALQNSSTPFVASYTRQSWPVDTLPALVALRGHTHIIDDRYEPLISEWLEWAFSLKDPATGLLPHRTDYQTGETLDGARATSQTLILRFLLELDPALAQQQYKLFREQYLVTRLGLPGIREYPLFRSGPGDIDSGPLLMDVSLSATAVFLGTGRLYNDREVVEVLWQGGEALGMPLTWNGRKQYALGLLPIGDAFAVWSKAAVPWFSAVPEGNYEAAVSPWWRLPWHGLSLAIGFVLIGVFGRWSGRA